MGAEDAVPFVRYTKRPVPQFMGIQYREYYGPNVDRYINLFDGVEVVRYHNRSLEMNYKPPTPEVTISRDEFEFFWHLGQKTQ